MNATSRKTSEEILNEAKTFYNTVRNSGSRPTWSDYEHFKKMLHNEGWFGYEFQLAKILHI